MKKNLSLSSVSNAFRFLSNVFHYEKFSLFTEKSLKDFLHKFIEDFHDKELMKTSEIVLNFTPTDAKNLVWQYRALQKHPEIFEKIVFDFSLCVPSLPLCSPRDIIELDQLLLPEHKKIFSVNAENFVTDYAFDAYVTPTQYLEKIHTVYSLLKNTSFVNDNTPLVFDKKLLSAVFMDNASWLTVELTQDDQNLLDKIYSVAHPSMNGFLSCLTGYAPKRFSFHPFELSGEPSSRAMAPVRDRIKSLTSLQQQLALKYDLNGVLALKNSGASLKM